MTLSTLNILKKGIVKILYDIGVIDHCVNDNACEFNEIIIKFII